MLEHLAQVWRRDLFDSVLPFWERHSIDREHGGFFTCLDRGGAVYDSRKYVWLNGRQTWMFARLYNEVERRPEWLEIARGGAGFLRRHARGPEGRCYFSLTRDGRPYSHQRKPYAAVFVALGWLEYWRASGEEWAREGAADLFQAIRGWIARPETMGRPVMAGEPAVSQLAGIMVQASLALEFARLDADPLYRRVMAECLEAALEHADPHRGVFLENVSPSGEDLSHLPEGRLFCPGHSAEVCWFLLHILEHMPDPGRQERVLRILENVLESGWDHEFGGLYYFMDVTGRPCLQLEAPMKLWWPHTEALYALVLAHTTTRERKWLEWIERVHEYTYRVFPDSECGEWFGYADRRGFLTHTLKGNNYKGCFHVPRALLFCLQRLEGKAFTTARRE